MALFILYLVEQAGHSMMVDTIGNLCCACALPPEAGASPPLSIVAASFSPSRKTGSRGDAREAGRVKCVAASPLCRIPLIQESRFSIKAGNVCSGPEVPDILAAIVPDWAFGVENRAMGHEMTRVLFRANWIAGIHAVDQPEISRDRERP
jgi:hypothetical protein